MLHCRISLKILFLSSVEKTAILFMLSPCLLFYEFFTHLHLFFTLPFQRILDSSNKHQRFTVTIAARIFFRVPAGAAVIYICIGGRNRL